MSWETQSWAAKQRPGSASAKLVLLGLASCSDANHCAFPSIQWLCDFSDLNRKTVIAALQRLEDGMFPMIRDTGERRGRTSQVKVYRLAAAEQGAPADPASDSAPRPANGPAQTVPKAEQSQKRNSSGFSGKQSQNRDTEPYSNLITPLSAKADSPPLCEKPAAKSQPAAKRAVGLPDDFTPVLTAKAQALVDGWPPGRLDTELRNFIDHAADKGRVSKDWQAAFRTWITKADEWMKRDASSRRSQSRPSAAADCRDGFAAAIYRRANPDPAADDPPEPRTVVGRRVPRSAGTGPLRIAPPSGDG